MSGTGLLNGKVAIVTGGGRGIGRAISLALASKGAAIGLVARTSTPLEETAAVIRQRGGRAVPVEADISEWGSVQAMVAQVERQLGPVGILVNNAGVQGPIGPMVQNPVDEWVRTIATNLVGTFHCCRAVAPTMMEQAWGRIINLSGGGAAGSRPNFSSYAASKAAIVRLTEVMAEELLPHNILVNAIAPGTVNTGMLDEVLSAGPLAGAGEQADAQRRRRSGGTDPHIAAELATFLASDGSDGLTGRLISALHDPWRAWAAGQKRFPSPPWLALRRLDAYTLRSVGWHED
jgi:3-oxoacyl-[acyl-carrier protein] reductase